MKRYVEMETAIKERLTEFEHLKAKLTGHINNRQGLSRLSNDYIFGINTAIDLININIDVHKRDLTTFGIPEKGEK